MFVEIAFIQKFILFLSHPLYAVAVVLCAFLVFAGLGSRASRPRAAAPRDALARSPPIAAARAALCVRAAAAARAQLMALPDAARDLLSIALIAPLAFAMGMPFPLGLARVAAPRRGPDAVGLGHQRLRVGGGGDPGHGARDPLGAVAVVLLAVAIYGLAAWQFPRED